MVFEMKTPQQIKNEVEKGCGEYYENTANFGLREYCGLYDGEIKLCPNCGAKLSILTEYDKAIKEMIELFKDDSIYTGRIVKFEIKNRMFSKIGDNSEVEK